MQTPLKKPDSIPARASRPEGNRKGHGIVLLLLLVVVAVYLWTAPARQEAALKKASLDVLESTFKEQPENPRVAYYLGRRLREAGRINAASMAFKQAAEHAIDSEEIWLAWAATQQDSQTAFDILSLFLAQHPHSAPAHLALAQCYEANRAHKRAYEEAAQSALLDPSNADAWRLAGASGMAWGQKAAAMSALHRAGALQPGDWRNRIALGDALSQTDNPVEALACFREAVRLAPEEAVAHLSLGRFLLGNAATTAEIEAARRSLLTSASLAPDLPPVSLLLGESYARQRDWNNARKWLETARRLAPNDYRVAFGLARVYGRLGDAAAASRETARHQKILAYNSEVRMMQERIVQNKNDPQLRLRLARVCAARGDYAEAARQYRQLLSRVPDMEIARKELVALKSRSTSQTDDPANLFSGTQP